MIHPVAFVRWARDAGWRDALDVLLYPFVTWRCRLFGHKWGPEESTYDPNIDALLETSRSCERPRCSGWWETYNAFGPARGKLG